MSIPSFAVVGHPNKGKSSIVATLVQDDAILIESRSGTTTENAEYSLTIADQTLYTLIDTPGFQRSRAVLAWLQQHNKDLTTRSQTLQQFISLPEHQHKYPDECQLLAPLMQGAGIIYVVDGSSPFGPEYQAEMEILRWTGRASLALINPIDNDDYVESWQQALNQFFKVVRVFNPFDTEFSKHQQLLKTFALLDEAWQKKLDYACDILQQQLQQRQQQSAMLISQMISNCLRHSERVEIPANTELSEQQKTDLQTHYQQSITSFEQQCRKKVESIYRYDHLVRQEAEFEVGLISADLFDQTQWQLYGLNKTQLTAVSAASMAGAGSLIDLSLGGASFMLGAIGGGISGAAGAWLYSDKIAEVAKQNSNNKSQTLSYGPSSNLNFPFVLLGRALAHHQLLLKRTHAYRDTLNIKHDNPTQTLNLQLKSKIMSIFNNIKKDRKLLQQQQELAALLAKHCLNNN